MHSIEQEAVQTYQKNLSYFESYHPELHKKLLTLETAISNQVYQEKYTLEYKEEGYFDIQDVNTQSFLYGEDSNAHTKKLLKSVDLRRTGAVFEAQQRFPIKEEELNEIGEFKNFHSSLWATAKIIHYNSKVAPKFSSQMEKLPKFIFLGTALGFHIEKIILKFNIGVVYIQEKNLEIFRLSLFTTNYADTLKSTKAYFSVMQNFSDMQYTFTSFLNEQFNYNLYIKFLPFVTEYQEDLESLQSITLSQNHIMYPYQAYMARSFNAADKISKGNCFFNIHRSYDSTPFSTKPILVLAAGPSLQNNTEWIVKNQDKFLIVGVLSACKHLFHHKIHPDIVVHVDPQELSSTLFGDIDVSYFNDSTIILGSSVHAEVVKKFQRNDIIFIEEATNIKASFGCFTLPSIGEYATMLPLILGAKDLYLIGIDLALDPNTMKDHIDLHTFAKTLSNAKNQDSVEYQKSVCYVKGNFLDIVPSKPNFRFSLSQFSSAIKMFKQSHQSIYNLSNGAYLDGTIPLEIGNITINNFSKLNKSSLKQEIDHFLISNSSCEFREVDRAYMQSQIDITKSIIGKINELRKTKPKEAHNYLYKKLIPFMQDICEMHTKEKSDIGEIFLNISKLPLVLFLTLSIQKIFKILKSMFKQWIKLF